MVVCRTFLQLGEVGALSGRSFNILTLVVIVALALALLLFFAKVDECVLLCKLERVLLRLLVLLEFLGHGWPIY